MEEKKKNEENPISISFAKKEVIILCPKQATELPAWPREVNELGHFKGSVKGKEIFKKYLSPYKRG